MRYQPVDSSVWRNRRFKYEFSSNARVLWFYLLTTEHASCLGIYKLSTGYATADLNWRTDRYQRALQEILKPSILCTAMAQFDRECEVIYLPAWLLRKPLQNDNQVKAGLKALDELPDTPLLNDFRLIVQQLEALRDKPLYEPLLKQLDKRLSKGFKHG